MDHEDKSDTLATRPECFVVTSVEGVHTIAHTRERMGCLNAFLSIWFVGWTIGCIWIVIEFFNGGKMEDGSSMPLGFVMFFLTTWALVACCVAYAEFARKFYKLEQGSLEVTTQLFSSSSTMTIPKDAIVKLQQVQDGLQGDDSFPSWGLQIECTNVCDTTLYRIMTTRLVPFPGKPGNHTRSLMRRQPYEQSRWLGIAIAEWAGVEVGLLPRPAQGPD